MTGRQAFVQLPSAHDGADGTLGVLSRNTRTAEAGASPSCHPGSSRCLSLLCVARTFQELNALQGRENVVAPEEPSGRLPSRMLTQRGR